VLAPDSFGCENRDANSRMNNSSLLGLGCFKCSLPRVKRQIAIVAAEVARKRLARGVKLNGALITDAVVEGARDGRSVADMMGGRCPRHHRERCMGIPK
jgi:hypothetical protein